MATVKSVLKLLFELFKPIASLARDSLEEEEQPSVEATEEHNALPTNHQRAVEHDGTVPNQMATDLSPRRLKSVSLSAPLKVSDEFEQDPKFTRVRITMVAK